MINTGGKSNKWATFQFEVLFLEDKLEFTEQSQAVDSLAQFSHHPRKLAEVANQQKMKVQESIQSCLKQFRTAERLGSDDSWYCGRCKKHVDAYKQLELYRVAPVLIFSFNRFKSHNVMFNEKMTDRINFPIYGLDMSHYVLSSCESSGLIYDLHGVINHYGDL